LSVVKRGKQGERTKKPISGGGSRGKDLKKKLFLEGQSPNIRGGKDTQKKKKAGKHEVSKQAYRAQDLEKRKE